MATRTPAELVDFQAIAADLDLCDIGLALTKGATRRKYATHRKACFAAIKEANKADGLDSLSDDELFAELGDDGAPAESK